MTDTSGTTTVNQRKSRKMKRRLALATLIAPLALATAGLVGGRTASADQPTYDGGGTGLAATLFADDAVRVGGDCGACDQATASGGGIFDGRFGILDGCGGNDGEPVSVFGSYGDFSLGGWVQLGYHNQNLPLFNSRKHEYQLHQAWVYAENAVDGSCGFDLGGRIDYIYGTDGPDTQAFGIDNDHWDNDFDNGPDYGHAIPQVYGEAAYGNVSAKVGHFYTIIGYEVVTAPDNFFYSHAYTMYNSEPFTHTGALVTYTMNDHIEYYGGYVLGWDSGFEDNGDAFLGGSSIDWTDDLNVTSTIVAGRFNENVGGAETGYMSSTVAQLQLTEPLSYVLQVDYLDTESPDGGTVRETFDINQYLFRQINDQITIGARMEWWNVDATGSGFRGDAATDVFDFAGDFDVYALTLGLNYRPNPNVIIRPEVRFDWVFGDEDTLLASNFLGSDPGSITFLDDGDDQQTTVGIDTIFLY